MPDAQAAPRADKSQTRVSKGQAGNLAQQKYGGKVLKVSLKGQYYHVKLLLESGRVKQIRVNASNGKVQ